MDKVECPNCYSTEFKETYLKDGAYICDSTDLNDNPCNTFAKAFCKKCNKLYDPDQFAKHDDVYICKECGEIQWGCTQYFRDHPGAFSMNFLEVISRNLMCPTCKAFDPVDKDYLEDGLLVCNKCGKVINIETIVCKTCDQMYKLKRFGIVNNNYVCKKCGSIQWGLTEYARNK